jgi:hypothetical protein
MHTRSRRPRRAPSIAAEDIYTFGDSPTGMQMLKGRTAQEQASFFLPYVRPGMCALDCKDTTRCSKRSGSAVLTITARHMVSHARRLYRETGDTYVSISSAV